MSNDFETMDSWTREEVAEFKEAARLKDAVPQDAAKAFRLAAVPKKDPGLIVAEGDSWFDYLPGTDLIDCLTHHGLYGYEIDNHAKAGDTLENMIYGTEIDRDFHRAVPEIDSILARIARYQPKVFLFSGGGNDIAGDEFESFLNHSHSGLPALREDFANQMIDVVFRKYFEDLIFRIKVRSPHTHIVTHGYGHPIPTGKGVDLLAFSFAGPWLRPALVKKGILDESLQKQIVFGLIDAYNEMLKSLDLANEHFHHVDLRAVLDPDTDWVNELHLKNSAYRRAAAAIHATIQSLL